ncbi:MAG TPA: hypothetical protein VKZ84_00940 [Bacteriovoracaceae bacterium]|nr:hypothetical protein [Bacteriovoracaceae bacterium]
MKRKEIFSLISPLVEQLYQFAFALLPDELEAEQLVIDGVNGFIIKEKKLLESLEVEIDNELRRFFFQKMVGHIYSLANKRIMQFKLNHEDPFYRLPLRDRAIMTLRYQMNYAPENIEDFLGIARWEVIEGIHNSRFMLTNQFQENEL